MPTDALQPSDYVRDVRAEDAPIAVHLVDNDVAQVLEELMPAGVVRQDAGVQHVRVGDDDVAGLADQFPFGRRGVAVVGVRLDIHAGGVNDRLQAGVLVLGQRLGREEVHRPRRRISQQRVEDRQVVAERLTRSGRGDDDSVATFLDRIEGVGLVRVELGHAALGQRPRQSGVERLRHRRGDCLLGRDRPPRRDARRIARLTIQPVEKVVERHRTSFAGGASAPIARMFYAVSIADASCQPNRLATAGACRTACRPATGDHPRRCRPCWCRGTC